MLLRFFYVHDWHPHPNVPEVELQFNRIKTAQPTKLVEACKKALKTHEKARFMRV